MACFILAGLTGFLFRLGMLGWTGGLNLSNIRHAHSHLMFFGWAIPLPLYILLRQFLQAGKQNLSGIKWMKNSLVANFIFGLASYPFFLLYGYNPVHIGPATMPLSVIFSGIVMLSWYGFMIGYLKNRTIIKTHISTPFFDGSLIMLLICSLGAWGAALVQMVSAENQLLMKGLTHFFLSTFTEGWLVLVLAAVILYKLEPTQKYGKAEQIALSLIVIGAPLTFPYGISESLMSNIYLLAARAGGLMIAAGLSILLFKFYKLGKWRSLWFWPLTLLAVKALVQAGASVSPSDFWFSNHGLRIFYLHILLLGSYSLAMFAWLTEATQISEKYFYFVVAAVIANLMSLLLSAFIFPSSLSGIWIIEVLAIFALLPVLAVSILFYMMLLKHKYD